MVWGGAVPQQSQKWENQKKIFSRLLFIENREVHLKTRSYLDKVTHCIDPTTSKCKFLVELFINIFLCKITAILTDRKAKAGSLPSCQWLFVFTQKTNILISNLSNVAEQQNYIICIDSSDSWLVCKSREDLTAPSAPIKYGQSTELPVSDLLRLIQRKCLSTQLTKRYHWSDLT